MSEKVMVESKKVVKSKTIGITNIAALALIVYAKNHGVELSPEEAVIVTSATFATLATVLRFFTKGPVTI